MTLLPEKNGLFLAKPQGVVMGIGGGIGVVSLYICVPLEF